jgi:hypothetical protein
MKKKQSVTLFFIVFATSCYSSMLLTKFSNHTIAQEIDFLDKPVACDQVRMNQGHMTIIEILKIDHTCWQLLTDLCTMSPKIFGTRTEKLQAAISHMQDATGITALRNGMQRNSPKRQALDRKIAKINKAFLEAFDKIFDEQQYFDLNQDNNKSIVQRRLYQIQAELTILYNGLRQQCTICTTPEELVRMAESKSVQQQKAAQAAQLSRDIKVPADRSMFDVSNPCQPTKYAIFLHQILYADLRASLKNQENTNNGFTSPTQVAYVIADKIIEDSGLSGYLIFPSRAKNPQVKAINRKLVRLRTRLVANLTRIFQSSRADLLITRAMDVMRHELERLQALAVKLIGSHATSRCYNGL